MIKKHFKEMKEVSIVGEKSVTLSTEDGCEVRILYTVNMVIV